MEQLVLSGLSIKDSLEVASMMNRRKKGIDISSLIFEKIQKGQSFADAINEMSDVFPPVYRGIISVGDRVGSVEKIFPRLRLYLETQKKIKDKLLGAMIYPLMVMTTALVAFVAMIIFVFPKLKTMFMELGGDASIILEKNIIKLETAFSSFLIFILLFIIILVMTKLLASKNKDIKIIMDSILLKLPVLGKFFLYLETLNFSFAMETLSAGGVTVENAIRESKNVITNEKLKSALDDIILRIVRGESLSSSFSIQNIFPSYISKWIMVGEKTGKPELVFSQIRNYFQNEIDIYTSRFMAMVEPALIIIIGIILAIFILTIIVPVFSLYGSIL